MGDTSGRAVRLVTICEPKPLTALVPLNVAVEKVQVAAVSGPRDRQTACFAMGG